MYCWWLVAAARDIVRDDLPEGWGLLIPHGPRALRVVVGAVLKPEAEPMPHTLQGALLRPVVTTEARLAQVDLDGPERRQLMALEDLDDPSAAGEVKVV